MCDFLSLPYLFWLSNVGKSDRQFFFLFCKFRTFAAFIMFLATEEKLCVL